MTKKRTYYARCPECGAYPGCCKDCGAKTTGSTPFSDWIRSLEAPLDSGHADLQNLDYIWFVYRRGWFITMEEKMFGKNSSSAQSDTHNVISQLLFLGSQQPVKTMRGTRKIEYRGHYLVSFQNTTPDDSKWIRINGMETKPEAVYELLKKGSVDGVHNGIDLPTGEEIQEWEQQKRRAKELDKLSPPPPDMVWPNW